MRPQWILLSNSLTSFNKMVEEFAEGVSDVRTKKAFKKLCEQWVKIINQQNEFDKLVEPIAAIDIKLPFEGNDFAEMWKTYKEYLLEDYNIQIGSRRQNIILSRLRKYSGNNQQRAIEMLELFIANGYKSMFKPTDKQLTGEEPSKTEEHSDFNITKPTNQV